MAGTASGGARRSRLAPYLLVAPGILWLLVFFVVPIDHAGPDLGRRGRGRGGRRTSKALGNYGTHFFRSFRYALGATLLALALGYPLAYFIAFRAGKFKNLLLGLVVLPFFTTFLVRTFAWKTILNDGGPAVWLLQRLHILGDGRPPARHHDRGGRRPHLQLPAVHDPADLREPREDRPAAGRGGRGPVLDAGRRVPQGGAAALAARGVRRQPAHLHPGRRRLHQRPAPRQPEPADDRHRHPEPVPRGARLSAGGRRSRSC